MTSSGVSHSDDRDRTHPAWPRIWGDVPPRNPNFVVREDLLGQLHSRLADATTQRPEVLLGMGGIGKSQTAVEYIYRYAHEYDLVWWIPAGNANIRASFVALAQRLDIAKGDEKAAVPAVLRELGDGTKDRRWILVFDDAGHPGGTRRFLPAGGGHVVVTSRNPEWEYVARTMVVTRALTKDATRHPEGTYVICVFDLEKFGAGNRTQQNRMAIRRGMHSVVKTAFERAGIPWQASYRRDTGDGILIAVPAAGANKGAFVGELLTALTELLDEHNNTHPEEAVRLRLALHVGEIAFDSLGPDGPGFVHATRLIDAEPLKTALAQSVKPLAVITSAYVHDEVVKQHDEHAPDAYRRVTVQVKETKSFGWIRIPDDRLPTRWQHSVLRRVGRYLVRSVRDVGR